MLTIHRERPADIPAIHAVNQAAFGRSQEANLVDALRRDCADLLSLVALLDGVLVGHILFSPATVAWAGGDLGGMGLGPLAVHPEHQSQRVGARLVRRGLALLARRGCPFVVVLGHPGYYPRFGFERASRYRVSSQWPSVPDEAFMLLLFDRSLADRLGGVCTYREEFNEVE
jgi:putative acetyltransferase